jgi:GrpB-like predicted nucleotidyltransferase (UPF0157 family)
MTTPVIIEEYDPRWPQQFELLRSRTAASLGELAAAIEHIGGTAVPGLAAKAIIDMDVLIKSNADLPLVISRLDSLGYQHRGDLGVPGREAFRPPPNDPPHHLYVCVPECLEYTRHITFRNHLRTHPQDANAYAALKRQLAEKLGSDRESYTQAKSEFVQDILRRAQPTLV